MLSRNPILQIPSSNDRFTNRLFSHAVFVLFPCMHIIVRAQYRYSFTTPLPSIQLSNTDISNSNSNSKSNTYCLS